MEVITTNPHSNGQKTKYFPLGGHGARYGIMAVDID